ncbi:MAG: tape measure protein [Acidaminococcaceae bacterium]|nr:tape measure protein [Acidaminococcaceae bacterium]
MASARVVSVAIKAVDYASRVIEQVKGSLKGLTDKKTYNIGEISRVKDSLNQVAGSAKKTTTSVSALASRFRDASSGAREMNVAMEQMSAAMTLGVAGMVAGKFVSLGVSAVKAAGQIEQYEIAFQTMLKSEEKGTAMLRELQDFAARTPFDVPGVVETAQQLMAFGFVAEDIIPTLRILGDASAGLGKGSAGVKQLGYVLGQISTSGTLKTQDVNQMATAGINVWQALADSYGKSITEIKEMTERGMIDSASAVKIITDSMAANFGGMMEKMENSINGILSNIEETAGTFAATFGDYMVQAFDIKGIAKDVADTLGELTDSFRTAKAEGLSFTEALAASLPGPVTAAFGALAAVVGVTLVAAAGAAVVALGGIIGLTAPVVAGVAAAGAAVASIVVYWDDFKERAEAAGYAVIAIVKMIVAGFIELGNLIVQAAQWAFDTMLDYASGFFEQTLGYCPSFVTGFRNMLDDTLGAISEWCTQAVAMISEVLNLQNDFHTSGTSDDWDVDPDKLREWREQERAKKRRPATPVAGPKATGGGGSSVDRVANQIEQLKERVTEHINSFGEKIISETGTGYEKGIARLNNELRKAQEDIDKAAGLGIDTSGLKAKMDEYAGIVKNNLADKLRQAQEDMRNETALTLAKATRDSQKEADAQYAIDLTALERKRETLLKQVAEHQGSLESRLAVEQWYAAQVALLDENRAQKGRESAQSWGEAWSNATTKLVQDFGTKGEQMQKAMDGVAQGMSSGFGDLFTDVLTGQFDNIEDSFKSMLRSMLRAIANFLAQQMVTSLFSKFSGGGSTFSLDPMAIASAPVRNASGGYISGPGTGTSDSIPAMLSNGEYVINAKAASQLGLPFLDALNSGAGIVRYASGGSVGSAGVGSHVGAIPPPEISVVVNNNSGQDMTATQTSSYQNGKWLVELVLSTTKDAINTNQAGIRDDILAISGGGH